MTRDDRKQVGLSRRDFIKGAAVAAGGTVLGGAVGAAATAAEVTVLGNAPGPMGKGRQCATVRRTLRLSTVSS